MIGYVVKNALTTLMEFPQMYLMISMKIVWMQAILNMIGIATVHIPSSQLSYTDCGKSKRCLNSACAVALTMYSRPKWQYFGLEHLDTVLLNWSLWLSCSCFQENLPVLCKVICVSWWIPTMFHISKVVSAIRV